MFHGIYFMFTFFKKLSSLKFKIVFIFNYYLFLIVFSNESRKLD